MELAEQIKDLKNEMEKMKTESGEEINVDLVTILDKKN